jgi:hypothetical protein
MEIRFEGALTKDEFLSISKLGQSYHGQSKNLTPVNMPVILMVVGTGLAAIGAWLWTVFKPQASVPGLFTSLLLIILGILAIGFGVKLRGYWSQVWEQNEALRSHREGTITEQGLEVHTPFGQTKLEWKELSGYGEYDGILVLYQGTATGYPIPRRFFESEEGWQSALSVVAERLERTHQVQESSPRIANILIWGLILAALVLILIRIVGH